MNPNLFPSRYVLLLAMLLSLTGTTLAQNDICTKANEAYLTIDKYHVGNITLDDTMSSRIFNNFLMALDPTKSFLSLEDYHALKKYAFAIDDQIRLKQCDLISDAYGIYTNRLKNYNDFLSSLKQEDLLKLPTQEFNICENEFYKESDLHNRWSQELKFSFLYEALSLELDSTAREGLSIDELISIEQCKLSSKISDPKSIRDKVDQAFLSAMTYSYDPHTAYFDTKALDAMESGLSSQVQSFGFTIVENGRGEFQVANIIPGSSAWHSGSIKESDIVTAIGFPGGETIRLNCLYLSDALSYLSKPSINNATFYLKNLEGQEAKISLEKSKETVNENIIESFILKSDKRIAYLKLPSFYSNSNEMWSFPNGSADDIAKELFRLQRENISGLIFDLRDNGGGDMTEALRICGMFIDKGALAIISDKQQQLETLKDMNRGVIYDGPLLVLVNNASASASELFASVMQDHNRAIVAGSNTFGKGTMQVVIPLEAYKYGLSQEYNGAPEDFIKLTTGRFYRVDGTSVQRHGVKPDVAIPSILNYLAVKESETDHALISPDINKKTYYWPSKEIFPKEKLQQLSSERVAVNPNFKKLDKMGKLILSEKEKCSITLSKEYLNKRFNTYSALKPQFDEQTFEIEIPSYKKEEIEETKNKEGSQNLSKDKDMILIEANNILKDLIQLKKQ